MNRGAVAAVPAVSRMSLGPAVVAALCLLPVLTAPVLPLVDFYAHALRYAILADAGRDPWLAENYRAAWALLPNLGLDVLGAAIGRVLPPLAAAEVLACLVILAPFAGGLVLARALHGRVGALSVALAGILSHSFILGWGFANFLLGLGLALAATGLWIMDRPHPRRQLATAMAAGIVIFLTHGFVFALWGLVLACVELAEAVAEHPRAALRRLVRLLPVAVPPALLFLASATAGGEGGATGTFDHIASHAERGSLGGRLLEELGFRADAALRVAESGWPMLDRIFGIVLWGLLGTGLLTGRLRLDPRLRFAVALAVVLALAVPPSLFGVGHLPERLPLVLLALLAAGLAPAAGGKRLAQGLVVLLPVHLLMVTLAWAGSGRDYRAFLAAADRLPPRLLAAPVFAGASGDRDAGRTCKPLSFLLGLDRQVAVPTFANPTQQPLRIVGPLANAMAAADARTALTAAAEEEPKAEEAVQGLFAAGFDLVVLCHAGDTPAGAVAGAHIVASGRTWTLYQSARD